LDPGGWSGGRAAALDPASGVSIRDARARPGTAVVREAGVSGTLSVARSADMRYVGQGYELSVPFPDGPVDGRTAAALRNAFDRIYAHRYGYSDSQAAVELVTAAVTVTGAGPEVRLAEQSPGAREVAQARKPSRPVYFPETRGYVDCVIYDRARMPIGATITGPAIVEEPESTTVLPPGATAEIDRWANLLVKIGEG
jgi:N-methylhydantoinase A